jgi:hypothetical protein
VVREGVVFALHVSRHQHSPSIALIEEDSTDGKLPIEEYWSPESTDPEGSWQHIAVEQELNDGRG